MRALRFGMIAAVICDLDGLLADTEKHHLRAYQETLAACGIALTEQEYVEHWIRNGRGIADFIKRHQLPLEASELHLRKMARYRAIIQSNLEPIPGALPFLHRMDGCKKLALASNSMRDNVILVLQQLGIGRFFEAVVSCSDAPRAKPAPDIFEHAAKVLGERAARCVVVEDAQKGIEAAHRAGMRSIAVPNQHTMNDDFSLATVIVSSLDDVTLELVDSLE